MIRVYISSTYEDLKAYRERASIAIERFEGQAVRMERYTADDRRPLDKCLEDVRACDVYVLLIARRVGWPPPDDPPGTNPDKLSITELEHREAVKHKKPVLAFLLKADQPWDAKWIDEPPAAVEQFRRRADVGATRDEFEADPRDLGEKVGAAFGNWRNRNPRTDPVPGLLPYQIDRDDQTEPLEKAFLDSRAGSHRRPIVALLTATEDDAPDKLVERLRVLELRRWSQLRPEQADPARWVLRWPDSGSPADRVRRYFRGLASELRLDPWNGDSSLLASGVAIMQTPVVLYSEVAHDEWSDEQPPAIEAWLEAWRQFPDLAGPHPLCAVLSLQRPRRVGPVKGRLDDWFFKRAIQKLQKKLENRYAPLGELPALKKSHATRWLQRDVDDFLGGLPHKRDRRIKIQERLTPRIDALFEKQREHRMKPLAPELRNELSRAMRLDEISAREEKP